MTPAQPALKRTRFSEDVEVQVIENISSIKETAPSKAAQATVASAVASYPETIRTIATSASKAYNGLKSKIQNQEKTLLRFSNDDEIPGSAKLKFKLTAPPDIMESDDFKSQALLMEKAVSEFQKTAKQAIKTVTELSLNNNKHQVTMMLHKTMQQFCELILLENKPASK